MGCVCAPAKRTELEAIYQSLCHRKERLQKRLREEEILKRRHNLELDSYPSIDLEDIDDDFEDIASEEREQTESEVVDLATAARTIAELKTEIALLEELEKLALKVRRSGTDRKWEELSNLLQNQAEMFDAGGYRRKLVIFTEQRDTLNYLVERIGNLLGNPDAVVTIHGAMGREDRKKAEAGFKQDVTIQVLIATDAAGEGINLQRAHLMVNYDLPWNPNRLEQRFGRIHRIGQTEVCHLWNLVADETREGDVYRSLLIKLEAEQKALGGQVFDVLGKAIAGKELRELLIEAIRYGEEPEVKARLDRVVADKLDHDRLQQLLEERVLARDAIDASKVLKIRADMERAQARRLQPHFIASFFLEAFGHLGGTIRQRESNRYEITHVPSSIRQRDRQRGIGTPIGPRYERICFDKESISISGKPIATFVCPGHPLLDATLDLILEKYRDLLKQGAILVDPNDTEETVRSLVYLDHSIQDARTTPDGRQRVVSRRMQYVEIDETGNAYSAGYAPYLDYRPLTASEQHLITPIVTDLGLRQDLEDRATSYAIANLVSPHLQELRQRKEELIDKTLIAVKDRLTKEINYWDCRALELHDRELQGKVNAKLNSAKARARADELADRMQKRLADLEQERKLSPLPPIVVGSALVIPIGLLQKLQGIISTMPNLFARETKRVELAAMSAVMKQEKSLGYEPKDVSAQKCGWDIESLIAQTGELRLIEVKGRIAGSETVTVTKNEVLAALNKPDRYFLALVRVSPLEPDLETEDEYVCQVRYVNKPFAKEPDFGVSSINYKWQELWDKGVEAAN